MEPINLFCIKSREPKIYQNSSGRHYCERCYNLVTSRLSAEDKAQIGYSTGETTHTLAYLTQVVYNTAIIVAKHFLK